MNLQRKMWILASVSLLVIITAQAGAHCDSMDGPVIKDAQTALATDDVTKVLKWVLAKHEQEIKELFQEVLTVRKQGEAAKRLSERYFFESLVRIHRAGEGAPYTGLKPAGQVDAVIVASDKALDQKNVDELVDKITQRIEHEIRQRFQAAVEKKEDVDHSVEAGRAYVRAYVEFIHFVEGLHKAIVGIGYGHGPSTSETPSHDAQEASHEH